MNRIKLALIALTLAVASVFATAAPAMAVYVQTQVVNRGPVAFQIKENSTTRWLGVNGATSYFQFGWTDVDAYILGPGVCASVSVNGGGFFTKGPGYYGLPDAARDVQVRSRYC